MTRLIKQNYLPKLALITLLLVVASFIFPVEGAANNHTTESANLPNITNVSPAVISAGETITLSGTNLGGTIQFIDSIGRRFSFVANLNSDKTEVTFTLPPMPGGAYSVRSYAAADRLSNTKNLTINWPKPTIGLTINLGNGVFPDVAWHDGKLWIALTETAHKVALYHVNKDLTGLKKYKEFTFSNGDNSFPRLTVHGTALWLAFRNGLDLILWRSDLDTTENLGRAVGNDPVALGRGYIAWQKDEDDSVYRRSLTGGTETFVRNGLPTGISRVVPGGGVVMIDEDRTAFSGSTRAWFAGDLVVGEGPEGGVAGRFYNQNSTLFNLYNEQESFTPHAASNGNGLYAVATWGRPGVRVTLVSYPVLDVRPSEPLPGIPPECDPLPLDDLELLGECNYWFILNNPGPVAETPPNDAFNPAILSGLPAAGVGGIDVVYTESLNKVLIIAQKESDISIVGVMADPLSLEIQGSVMRYDNDDEQHQGGPLVAYNQDEDKFLIVWGDTRACGNNCSGIYGRFASGDGNPIGNSDFLIHRGSVFLGDVIYDSTNKKFVIGFEEGNAVKFKTVSTNGAISEAYKVVDSFPYQGQSGLTFNSNNNEYWFAYATVYTGVGANTAREDDRIFFSKVSAITYEVIGQPAQLSQTRLGRLAQQGGRIAYSTQGGAAMAMWIEREKVGTGSVGMWGRTIYDDGTMSDEYPIITPREHPASTGYSGGIINYNPWTDTFFVATGAWDGTTWITEIDLTGYVYIHHMTLAPRLAFNKSKFASLFGVPTAFAAVGNFNLTSAVTPFGTVSLSSQNYDRIVGTSFMSDNASVAITPLVLTPQPPVQRPFTPTDITSLPKRVTQIYTWALGIAALLALLMVVVGGYILTTSAGSGEQVSKGKEFIFSALIGLALIISAYLLLRTINPDLVNFNLESVTRLRQ